MFDKIQSTYFKRVTTGVLALFMTASSGFSYAVPVYAEEVTTAAAKRKKEEEFSSTESSTLTLRENDKKNEAEGSNTTETDGIKVTTNGSSDVQPEVKIEKPDNKKEPGRKLSSKKAQEDLKEMIQNKKYSYQDILQRIFEIDDFTFYSKLTLDEIKFLMSGTTEEKYEIAELLMYKSVYLYADYNITSEDFYSELSQYFQFLDECNVDLKDEEIEKIEKQLLLDINIYYVGDENLYQKDLDEYLTHIIETTSKGKQDICKKYIEEMHKYIFSNKTDRNRNNIRTVFGLKEEAKSEKETASEAIKKKAEDFSITEGSPLRKYSNQKYSSNTAFRDGCVFVYIKDSDTGLTTTGKLTVSRNNNVSWNYMQANTTWWNCKLDIISEKNYHNLSLRSPTVSTDLDAGSKDANGEYSKFIINIYLQYTQHAHHKVSNISYDAADAGRLNFNKYSQFDNAGGSIPWNLEHADTDQKDVNLQINTAQLGLRTINKHRYCGTSATITYSRPDYTVRYYDKANPNPIDTKIVSDGNTANTGGIPSDPSRDGYRFTGWKNHEGQSPWDKTICGADENFYAQWVSSGSTISIDPNGGTYKGSSGVTTVNNLSPGATITVDSPTRPGYKFGGYDTSHGDYQYFASNNGWTTSHGENVGTYSRSFDGNVSLNEAPDGGYYRTNHVWRGIDSATDNYNCISFPTYTAQAGHTYKISGEVWISERPSGGSFALNFYHGDSSNDWKHCMWGISEGWTGKWVKFSMERTFDTTTNDARFEIWTSNLKGLTGNISFWLQGLKITDETTGNDVSMTKIAMGDSDIKLTARWIPLHSTLSYDTQGGSLDSVKSTDNPNNYKIVDNGEYFIQSGLNSSRYLHDYDCSAENGAKVCTFQGYGANAKQCIWTFERYKNTPYYYIINKYNGKALNLSGDGPGDLSGQTVEMWTQLNAANKNQSDFLWYFKDAGDGYVTICNKYTDKALDIPNGEDNDNVKLQQYTPNGTASQKFKLVNNSQVYFPTREKYTDSNVYINSATPVKKGCKFLGWSTSANGNVVYQPGDLYDVNQDGGNVTLYAKWEKAKYTATVKLNGGSYNGSTKDFTISKYPGEEISIGAPTRSKHNFTGYKLTMDNNDGNAPTSVTQSASGFKGIMQMGNFTLNAQWTPWKHTVRYDANAKNDTSVKGIPASQSKTANVDIKLSSSVPTRNGYTFLGWNTKADGKGTAYAAGAIYKNDQNGGTVTLYAQWTPWKHVLHYNKNVPTSSTSQTVSNMPVDQTKTFGQLMTISNLVPTRKGYTFAGWYTQSNGTGTKYNPGSNYAADQNGGTVNLYAKWTAWKHTVTYDKNVPANSKKTDVKNMPGNQTKIYDQNLTLQSNVPTRIGYTFVKWTTNKDGTGTAYQPGSQYSYNRDSDGGTVTLYAVWTPWKYTVRYDKNVPASSSSQTVSNMPADQTKTEEVNLTLSSNKPSRNGYIFNGWQAQINGKAVDYQPGATLSYDPDAKGSVITLKAKWTAWKHTIHYDKNVPASSSSQTVANMPEDDTKTFDITKTISSTKPSRNGYIFNGWNTQKDGKGTAYASGAAYKHDQNGGTVTLYAQWTPWKHTVTYDKNVDSSSSSQTVTNMPGNQTKTFDEKLMISSTKPSRNGYIFNGWNTQKNGKGTAYASGAEYKHDQNGNTVTLYAQWTAWKHTVHYNANGGDQNSVPTDQTKIFDQAMILSDKKPTRHGYNFVRWNTKADGTGTSYEVKGNYNHDQNGGTVTLYAIWTPWVHTVHYDANGGDQNSVPNDQKKTYGQSMNVATKVPTRNEYKFLGWTTGKDGSGTFYNPGDAYYHDQNGQTVTLYAKWIQLYTVKYDGNQPAIKGVTVTGSVANQTQGQDESVNLRTNNFKNNSGIYKDWSVGKDAYKYAKQDGKIREFIHPEGFKTNHSAMQNELYDYTGSIAHQ